MHFLIRRPREKKFQSMQVFYTPPTSPVPSTDTGSDNLVIHFMDINPGENLHHIQLDERDRTTLFIMGDIIVPCDFRHSDR